MCNGVTGVYRVNVSKMSVRFYCSYKGEYIVLFLENIVGYGKEKALC